MSKYRYPRSGPVRAKLEVRDALQAPHSSKALPRGLLWCSTAVDRPEAARLRWSEGGGNVAVAVGVDMAGKQRTRVRRGAWEQRQSLALPCLLARHEAASCYYVAAPIRPSLFSLLLLLLLLCRRGQAVFGGSGVSTAFSWWLGCPPYLEEGMTLRTYLQQTRTHMQYIHGSGTGGMTCKACEAARTLGQ